MLLSTSPLDAFINPIRASIKPRAYGLKNRERTNRMPRLIHLDANVQDDVHAYTHLIRAWLEGNSGRPGVDRRGVETSGEMFAHWERPRGAWYDATHPVAMGHVRLARTKRRT